MVLISSLGKSNYSLQGQDKYLLSYPCADNDCYPYKIDFKPGKYLLECWGASGSSEKSEFVRGAYVSGILKTRESITLYAYLGNVGKLNGSATFNGGGSGSLQGYSGGGATDFRLYPADTFSSTTSLLSRIMVAGGGAGLNEYQDLGATISEICDYGQGGAEVGGCGYTKRCDLHNYTITHAFGGTQTEAGLSGHCIYPCSHGHQDSNLRGSLGVGVNSQHNKYSSGGGGGYFGGGAGAVDGCVVGSGGGGSSYVSGHPNCSSLSPNIKNALGYIVNSKNHIHYSGIQLMQPNMIDGHSGIVEPDGSKAIGHTGAGYARITVIDQFYERTCKSSIINRLLMPLIYISILRK